MAYLGDIRENSIGPNGEIWESDNRVEERYYYNGMFIDLCGLSPEDYSKTIFVTNGSGSSDSDVTIKTNSIKVELVSFINEEGVSVYAYQAIAKQPVSSEITIQLVVENEGEKEVVNIVIPKDTSVSNIGATKITTESGVLPIVITSDYNPKKDEKFEYNTVLPESKPAYPMAYRITLPQHSIDNISDEELLNLIKASGKISMQDSTTSEEFMVEFDTISVEGLESMSMSEIQRIQIEKSQDIVFVTDKNIKSIEESGLGFNEIEKWTKRESTIKIDNVIFTVWYKRVDDNSQTKICDSNNSSFIIGGGKDDRKYIIYYE
jgi:hypothetical protein